MVMPKRANTPLRVDPSKHCQYHRNLGHSTKECTTLKDKIKELINKGFFKDFVYKQQSSQHKSSKYWDHDKGHDTDQDRTRREDRPRSRSRERRKHWSTKKSDKHHRQRLASEGCTSSTRKKHLGNVWFMNMVAVWNKVDMLDITFISADFKGLDPKQDNPMVISIELDNFLVWKTLIDLGNLTNILFWNTFKQLDIPESALQRYDESLFGFACER